MWSQRVETVVLVAAETGNEVGVLTGHRREVRVITLITCVVWLGLLVVHPGDVASKLTCTSSCFRHNHLQELEVTRINVGKLAARPPPGEAEQREHSKMGPPGTAKAS